MDETTFVRQELVERLDKLAVLMEEIALEALDAGVLDLATDLWVASARLLSTSDDLWQPVKDRTTLRGDHADPADPGDLDALGFED